MARSSPSRIVAFLGSINVGGRRAGKDELRAAFESLGHGRVQTFLASGNVVFETDPATEPERLTANAEEALERELGFPVPVFLRSAEEVHAIVAARPFEAAELAASGGKHQVLLLRSAPGSGARDRVLALATAEDRLAFTDRELHWLPNGGLSDSELNLKAIAAELGPTTTRTLNTIERIATKFLAA